MRYAGNLLRLGSYAFLGLILMLFALIPPADSANAQTGLPCNPLIPTDNLECPNGECRRFDANCGIFGFLCNDNPDENTRSGKLEFLCQWFCSGGRGVCEDSVVPCNDDFGCDARERCLEGVCSLVEAPSTPIPSRDLQCQSDSDCLDTEGCQNNRCRRKCTGTGTDPSTGCPTGEGCFNGFCAPL